MAGVFWIRILGPLHFEGSQNAIEVEDVVNLHAVTRAEVGERTPARIADPPRQFQADPLLETPAGVGQHGINARAQAGRRMTHSQVEEAKANSVSIPPSTNA